MNLSCGILWGFDWEKVRVWAHSVHRANINARKIVFTHNVPFTVHEHLHALNIETIDWIPKDTHLHPITTRWQPVLTHLAHNNYDNVIVTDLKDCVYQSDPFPWLEAHSRVDSRPIVLATENQPSIQAQENYNPWMIDYLGPDAPSMADKEVVCGGTIAGKASYFAQMIGEMYKILASHPNPRLIDQAVLNHLAHTSWRDRVSIPRLREGWILSGNFCWHSKLDPPPDFRKGLAYPKGGIEPFKLYHLYFPKHRLAIQTRYWDKVWDGTCHRCGANAWGPKHSLYGPRCLKCGDRYSYRGDSTYPA